MKGADEAATALQVCNRAAAGANAVKQYEAKLVAIPAPSPIFYAVQAQAPALQAVPATSAQPPQARPLGASENAQPKQTVEARLKKLDQLLRQGLITRKDYDAKKAQILSEL